MADGGEPGVVLDWDSRFFGVRVGRATAQRLDENSARCLVEWAAVEEVRCLYLLADPDDPATARLALRHGFEPVDVRIGLAWTPSGGADLPPSPSVRPFEEGDLPALRDLARRSHQASRFYFDGRFPRELCDRLYETWIERSCSGWADAVLVAEWRGEAAGYLSCHHEKDGGSRIGLVAIANAAQGSGLGGELVREIQRRAIEEGRGLCRVATQARNIDAQRLYQRHGFLTEEVGVWYHRWQPAEEAG